LISTRITDQDLVRHEFLKRGAASRHEGHEDSEEHEEEHAGARSI
jgi:hypothetical protein